MLHDFALSYALDNDYIQSDQVAFIDLALAIHRHSALIHSYYQFHDTLAEPAAQLPNPDCSTWLAYNGKTSCSSDLVFALETAGKSAKPPLLLPSDKVLQATLTSGDSLPYAVLYTDLVDFEEFTKFHTHLYQSALARKLNYVVRYRAPPTNADSARQQLTGYGAELYVKRTDYLVIDDRDTKSAESSENSEEADEAEQPSKAQTVLQPVNEGGTISKANLNLLGFKASKFILDSNDPFGALVNVSLDFPKYSFPLSEITGSRKDWANLVSDNVRSGSNLLYINGAPVPTSDDNVFSISKAIDRERNYMNKFKSLGLSSSDALDLILSEIDLKDGINGDEKNVRYDYRTPSLVWLNDLETDERYKQWSADPKKILQLPLNQILPPVRLNIHTIVYVIDFSRPAQYNNLAELLNLMARNSAIQIGVIPIVHTKDAEVIAREFFAAQLEMGAEGAVAFISGLMQSEDHRAIYKHVVGSDSDRDVENDEQVNHLVQEAKDFAERLDIDLSVQTVFTNGLITPITRRWFYDITDIVGKDIAALKQFVRKNNGEFEGEPKDFFLEKALTKRNSLINPTDTSAISFLDISDLYINKEKYGYIGFSSSGRAENTEIESESLYSFWVAGDVSQLQFKNQVVNALEFVKETKLNVKLNIVPLVSSFESGSETSLKIISALTKDSSIDTVLKSLADLESVGAINVDEIAKFQANANIFTSSSVTLVSGSRVISLPKNKLFLPSDLEMLYQADFYGRIQPIVELASVNEILINGPAGLDKFDLQDLYTSLVWFVRTTFQEKNSFFVTGAAARVDTTDYLGLEKASFDIPNIYDDDESQEPLVYITAVLDPISEKGQVYTALLKSLSQLPEIKISVILSPKPGLTEIPLKRFYRANIPAKPEFDKDTGKRSQDFLVFTDMPQSTLLNLDINVPGSWIALPESSAHDLDNIILDKINEPVLEAEYLLKNLLLQGHAIDVTTNTAPRGVALELGPVDTVTTDTSIMANLGYFQLKANPGLWSLNIKKGSSSEVFEFKTVGITNKDSRVENADESLVFITEMTGLTIYPTFKRKPGMELQDVLELTPSIGGFIKNTWNSLFSSTKSQDDNAEINIFTVASGHLYERFLSIMTISVMKHTDHTVKFWLIENFLSPSFKQFLPHLAEKYGFKYELISYKWPSWLRPQAEKQRTIWGYKILFLDVLFPQSLDKVIFVDADQIVRTDMIELTEVDLQGAPYGFTPMCDSREEIEGFRFWKQGYWKNYLGPDYKYHISALYVVDLARFRKLAAGDQLRQHYQMLSADPASLSNLDQDLPNHLQKQLPIFSLPQDWLWCETWCSDESLLTAKTIDLCNNPMTKEPKLDRARRQVPEWVEYDNLVASLSSTVQSQPVEADIDVSTTSKNAEDEDIIKPSSAEDNEEDDDLYDEL
ncbi:hypothetical protein D0Z00_003783 [Geotrichum galactomycetum]|uniref:Uncharacterized protein n=1 Tax=Geotrichum galactomycetum TaxID=27317 RepID=A0ACB6V0D0_9ASCO|nr:hypothetical protein D0Z00_003783 [Geotrichum candidum]